MTAIAHAFAAQTALQSNATTTFVDVLTLADTIFTAGKKYLIWATAEYSSTNGSGSRRPELRVIHGSTPFDDSLAYTPQAFALNRWRTYTWFHVWTAVSTEALKLQFRSINADTTARVDNSTIFTLCLTDYGTENTDWFFNELGTDSATLSATAQDGATITVAPSVSSKWLVASLAQINGTTGSQMLSRLVRSGEASSSVPEIKINPYDGTNHRDQLACIAAFTLAASNTFTEQSLSNATAHTRLHSKLFALNLSRFARGEFSYNAGDTALSSSSWATAAATASITPSATGPVWAGASALTLRDAAACLPAYRLQIDNADDPATQTTDAYPHQRGEVSGNVDPWAIQTVSSLSAAAHTLDLDTYNVAGGGGANASRNRTIWAVELDVPVPDTTAPTITGPGGATGSTSSITVAEGTVTVHTFTANESVTWSIVTSPDQARHAIGSGTGVLTFSPAPNFEAPTDTGSNNTSVVTVRATDGAGNFSEQTLTITIVNANEAPVFNGPSIGAQTATVGTAITPVDHSAKWSDPDSGDTGTYSATGLPPGLSVTGGTLSGTPTTAGAYSTTIIRTDGNGLTASSNTFTFTVSPTIAPGQFNLNSSAFAFKRNNASLIASASVTFWVYDLTTGARVGASIAGLSTNASGIVTSPVSNVDLLASTQYRVVWRFSTGETGVGLLTTKDAA